MKQHVIGFFAISVCVISPFFASAQDTILGKKAITVEAGYTIAYPILFSQYQYNATYSPVSGGGLQFLASYDYSLINHRHSILGVRFKAGYFQNHYLYNVEQQGSDVNSSQYEFKSYLGAGVGFYMIKRKKKIGFYNEMNIFGKAQVADKFSNSNQQPRTIDLACDGANNIYLNFQSGISLYITRNFSVMPFLAYPVFEISDVALWFPKLVTRYTNGVSNIYYSSFSAGVNLTYYLEHP